MAVEEQPDFAVVIATRNRPDQVRRTLEALDAQTRRGFDVTVVDQSDVLDTVLHQRALEDPHLEVVADDGRGVTRARNIGWRRVGSEWVVFLDDDCHPAPDFIDELVQAMARHPEASFISGHVEAGGELPSDDYMPVTPSDIREERVISGRWNLPWKIGFSLCMAVRRDTVEAIGSWDERFGPGRPDFPASDDMDFNYRFLRSGGVAYVTPRLRASHDQWRSPDELGPLFEGYMAAWSGFALKHLRTGDVLGGLWLWSWSLVDIARNLASAAKRRSSLRLRITGHKLRGLVAGTVRGIRTRW